MELAGRSALVAGGAGGLGGATVQRLTELGVGVVVLDPAPEASAPKEGPGNRPTRIVGDSNDDEAVMAAVAAAQSLGVFSIAVSATGVVIPSGRLVNEDGSVLPKDVLVANLEMHVVGPVNLARLSAAAFRDNEPDSDGQRGVIVQTASISAFDGQARMVPYGAAKGAITSMVLPMARDLAPLGIRVCAIAPGAFDTPRLTSESVKAVLLEDVVFPKRLGRPKEYAQLIETIVRNPYLNGETIRIDGATRLGPAMGWRSHQPVAHSANS